MDFATVCSGIDAPSVALEKHGWQAQWFSEIEAFPSAVLAHHWPEVPNLGDMTALPRKVLSGSVSAPSVLIGGTPCQAFSVAGMREGLADPRGALTIKFVELADAIDLIRYRRGEPESIVWWENVPGVLSDRENAFGCFLGALAGEDCELQPAGKKWTNAGCVYGPKRAVAWRVLDAQYFGVAQRRRRVFVVASARAGFDPAAVLFERESVRRDTPPSRETGQEVAGTLESRTGAGDFPGTDGACSGHVQPVGYRMAAFGEYSDDGTASTMKARDYKDATDLAVHSIQNATRGKDQNGLGVAGPDDPMYTLDQGSQHGVAISVHGTGRGQPIAAMAFQPGNLARGAGSGPSLDVFPTLKADHGRGMSDQDPHVLTVHGTQDPCVSDNLAFALGRNNGGENAVFTTREVAQTITQSHGKQLDNSDTALGPNVAIHGTQDPHVLAGCLTPGLPQRVRVHGAQGVAPTLSSEEGRGHGVPTVACFAENSRAELRLEGGDGSRTGALSTGGGKAGQGQPAIVEGLAVRRLTPVECERLQGFQDNHTAIPWRKKQASDCPDGPRYKAVGNSMAVPVIEWIGKRIMEVLR